MFKLPLALLALSPLFGASSAAFYAYTYRYQGALLCENGSIMTENRGVPLYGCWKLGYGCTYSRELMDTSYPGSHWFGYENMVVYHLYCSKTGGRVGICYKNNGKYVWTDSCAPSQDGSAVIVKTRTSRRHLRGDEDMYDIDPEEGVDFDGPFMTVEIDGEKVELVKPDTEDDNEYTYGYEDEYEDNYEDKDEDD